MNIPINKTNLVMFKNRLIAGTFQVFPLIAFLVFIFPALALSDDALIHSATPVNGSIQIDGNLDEEAWRMGNPITGFQQFEPNEGATSSQRTEVRVLYGDGYVYVGAMLYDEAPGEIEETLGRRDEYNRADWFLVSIDSYFNRRNAYTFGVNAAGVQLDALRSSGGGGGGGGGPLPPGMDASWDAIWESAVTVNGEGWIAEVKIPNSMLRFSDSEVQTWGIHFTRRIPRLGEVAEWPHIPRTERSNLVAQFGQLTEIRDIDPKPNIQIRPYTVAGVNSAESAQTPGEADVNSNMDVGGDMKFGLGPNVTLDATINPDFGQVETDPAVLNLTAFETTFNERRPFFVEGINIYEFSIGPGELLYTRRIGAQAPIIGAAKISGRTDNGLSFGVLGATSGENFDPTRNYGVARVRQQLGSFSEAGAILTGFDAPDPGSTGRIQSASGGVDWDFRLSENRYSMEGFATFTHRTFTAIEQNASTGFGGDFRLRKRQGDFNGFAGVGIATDEFNPNDIGQLRQNNYLGSYTRMEYQLNQGREFGPVRRAEVNMFGVQRFSYDERLDMGLNLRFNSNWTLMNFQEIQLGLNIRNPFGGYDLFETRGLGAWAQPSTFQISGEFNTDNRRNWRIGPEVDYTWHEDGGKDYSLGLNGNWNIGSRLTISGSLEGEWEDGVTAWASNESFMNTGTEWMIGERPGSPDQLSQDEYISLDGTDRLNTIFSGITPYSNNNWYVPVFGSRDTRSLDLTLRSNVTFSSKISLQFYSQLFLARGQYSNFQIMENRDELTPYDSYPKRSEFAFSNLQSNLVFRWEYRAGSNIYLVWTHGRQLEQRVSPLAPTESASPYEQSTSSRIRDTFNVFPENAVILKIEYTFLY